MIENENINPIERELLNTTEGSANLYDVESNSHPRRNSSRANKFRGFSHENKFLRQDDFLESMETFTKNELEVVPRNRLHDVHDAFAI